MANSNDDKNNLNVSIYEILAIILKDIKFRWLFIIGIGLSIFAGVFEIFFIYFVSTLLGGGVEGLPPSFRIEAVSAIVQFLSLVILATAIRFLVQTMSGYIGYLAACILGKSGLELLAAADYQIILDIGKVGGVNNLVNRINIFCSSFLVSLLLFIQSLTSVALIFAYLLYGNVLQVSIYFAVLPIFVWLVWLVAKKLTKEISTKVSEANAKVASNVISFFENYAVIKTYRISKMVGKAFAVEFGVLRFNQLLTQMAASSPKYILEGIGLIFFGVVTIGQSNRFTNNDQELYNALLLLAIAVFRAGPIIGNIVSALIQIGASVTDIKLLASFFKLIGQKNLTHMSNYQTSVDNKEEKNFYHAATLPKNSIVLQFNNVSFKYRTSNELTIENLNFTVKKGEFLGIKGASGSGKTTIINLICGLLHPTGGKIIFPETSSSNHFAVSSDVAIVEQNVVLFPRTLLFNITLKESSSRTDIIRVKEIVNKVGLGYLASDDNLNTVMGDGGKQVSGGQRQRIGLARALFSEAKIVVLDEFTSALDDDSENRCIEILKNLKGQVTAIIVSHRNEPLFICNKMIELRI